MLKLPVFFLNELKFSLRQGGLFFLLLLYPLLVIAIVGYAFNSQAALKAPLGIYSEDQEIIQSLSSQGGFTLSIAGSPNAAESLVRRGAVPASVIVTHCGFYFDPKPDVCDKRLYIAVVQDPSRYTEVSFLKLLFNSALMDKLTASAKNISEFQGQAHTIASDLPVMRSDLSNLRTMLAQEKTELGEVRDNISIDEIDAAISGADRLSLFFESAINQSSRAIAELDNLSSAISSEDSSLHTDLNGFDYKLYNLDSELNIAGNKRESYVARIDYYSEELDTVSAPLDSAYNYISTAYAAAPSTALGNALQQVGLARNEVASMKAELSGARADLESIDINSMRAEVASTRMYIAASDGKLLAAGSSADSRISNAKSTLEQFKAQSEQIAGELEAGKNRLAAIRSAAVAARKRIDDIYTGIDKLMDNTLQTDAKLDRSQRMISSFAAVSPEEFTPPKIMDRDAVSSDSRLLFNFPFLLMINIALFAVLFPIVITSKMAESGVEDSLRKRGAVLSYIAGRFAGDYVIVVFQTMLFFLFAFLMFRVVPLSIDIVVQFLAILLVILPFSALGFLLSRLVQKVATGLLVSLLLFIPMVFLSGKILPLTFMDPIVSAIGTYQPFTVALNVLELAFFRCDIQSCDAFALGLGATYLVGMAFAMLLLSTLLWYASTRTGRVNWGKKIA